MPAGSTYSNKHKHTFFCKNVFFSLSCFCEEHLNVCVQRALSIGEKGPLQGGIRREGKSLERSRKNVCSYRALVYYYNFQGREFTSWAFKWSERERWGHRALRPTWGVGSPCTCIDIFVFCTSSFSAFFSFVGIFRGEHRVRSPWSYNACVRHLNVHLLVYRGEFYIIRIGRPFKFIGSAGKRRYGVRDFLNALIELLALLCLSLTMYTYKYAG